MLLYLYMLLFLAFDFIKTLIVEDIIQTVQVAPFDFFLSSNFIEVNFSSLFSKPNLNITSGMSPQHLTPTQAVILFYICIPFITLHHNHLSTQLSPLL